MLLIIAQTGAILEVYVGVLMCVWLVRCARAYACLSAALCDCRSQIAETLQSVSHQNTSHSHLCSPNNIFLLIYTRFHVDKNKCVTTKHMQSLLRETLRRTLHTGKCFYPHPYVFPLQATSFLQSPYL